MTSRKQLYLLLREYNAMIGRVKDERSGIGLGILPVFRCHDRPDSAVPCGVTLLRRGFPFAGSRGKSHSGCRWKTPVAGRPNKFGENRIHNPLRLASRHRSSPLATD